jgi:hypothetical protein
LNAASEPARSNPFTHAYDTCSRFTPPAPSGSSLYRALPLAQSAALAPDDEDGLAPEDDDAAAPEDALPPEEDDDGPAPEDDGVPPPDDDGAAPEDDGVLPPEDDGLAPDDDRSPRSVTCGEQPKASAAIIAPARGRHR